MIWLFFTKFFIFICYYLGITAFMFILHMNNIIYLLEETLVIRGLNYAKPFINSNYDIIIVGGGTAGLTIAHGLNYTNVLVVEAGSDFQSHSAIVSSSISRMVHNIPMITPLLQLQNSFDWQYKTEPQEHACKGLNDNASHWPMGKGFGGTQLINNMIYHRGFEMDYKNWFNETPYNYTKDIEPYFSKFEEFLEISSLQSSTPAAKAFLKASTEIFNRDEYKNFRRPDVLQYIGRRWSVADSYNAHVNQRQHILLSAKVERVLFEDGVDGELKAIGIVYRKYGQLHEVRASRAVILSTGTVATPTILLKSGIGPEKLYSSFHNQTDTDPLKIKLRKNMPAVGQHLQDHVTTGLDLITLNQSLSLEPWNLFTPTNLVKYFWKGEGQLTMTGCEGLGFLKTEPGLDVPNLGFMLIPVPAHIDAGVYLHRLFNMGQRTWNEYYRTLIATPTISILPIVLHPKSRGYVSIKPTADGQAQTVIQPRYLSHPHDIDVLVAGIKIITELINTHAFRALGATITKMPLPGCEDYVFATDEYWQCYVQHVTLTAYHYAGTCRMGSNANDSVVSPDTFQVHGIEHLYVCDASVMPSLPSANPQAAVGMLANKFLQSFDVDED